MKRLSFGKFAPSLFSMKSTIINIGDARGVRLPEEILDAAGVTHAVNVELRGAEVVLTAADDQRLGGDAVSNGAGRDDLSRTGKKNFDDEEWEWPNDFENHRLPVVSKPIS